MMWKLLVISVNILAYNNIFASPTTQNNLITQKFQSAIEHQNFQTILISIEERLRNLDNIYSMHLSATLEEKLEQYHRKLEAIDTKINNFESLVMLNLDKISENISMKNYKDDIIKTNLFRNIDAIYDGLNHRLNYIDRKFDASINKGQEQMEATLIRIGKMEENFATSNKDIKGDMIEAIAAIDDLKTTCNNINKSISEDVKFSFKNIYEKQVETQQIIQEYIENTSENFGKVEKKIDFETEMTNNTNSQLQKLNAEMKNELNEYANKVADMNAENWRTNKILIDNQIAIDTHINLTKIQMQNGIRELMISVGKITIKEIFLNEEPQINNLDELNQKLDTNFDKILTIQNLFLHSCYRLQINESQIESKISETLEDIMRIFDEKTTIKAKDIKNMEKLLKSHHSIIRNLHQHFDENLKIITNELDTLFTLIQDTTTNKQNNSLERKHLNMLLLSLKRIENKLNAIETENINSTTSLERIKKTLLAIEKENFNQTTTNEYIIMKNISHILNTIDDKINKTYSDYFNKCNINNTTIIEFRNTLQKCIENTKQNNCMKGDAIRELLIIRNSTNNNNNIKPTINKNIQQSIENNKNEEEEEEEEEGKRTNKSEITTRLNLENNSNINQKQINNNQNSIPDTNQQNVNRLPSPINQNQTNKCNDCNQTNTNRSIIETNELNQYLSTNNSDNYLNSDFMQQIRKFVQQNFTNLFNSETTATTTTKYNEKPMKNLTNNKNDNEDYVTEPNSLPDLNHSDEYDNNYDFIGN